MKWQTDLGMRQKDEEKGNTPEPRTPRMEAPRGIPGKRDPRDRGGGEAICPELMTRNFLEMNTDRNPPAGSTKDERKDEKRAQTSVSSTQQALRNAHSLLCSSFRALLPASFASVSVPASHTLPDLSKSRSLARMIHSYKSSPKVREPLLWRGVGCRVAWSADPATGQREQ